MKPAILFSLMIVMLSFSAGCPMGGNTMGDGTDVVGDGDMMDDGMVPGDVGVETEYQTILTGGQEIPGVDTPGTGSGSFTLNADQTELTFNILASALSGPVADAHFHNGPVGQDGDVVFALGLFLMEEGGNVTISGTWPLLAEDVANLRSGNLYVNLHTQLNPGGEIRGQVLETEADAAP